MFTTTKNSKRLTNNGQVLELKMNLQRVRASNERRRAKLSERWTAKATAAAEGRRAAAERQRVFARQLEGDVDALEEKLGGLERQAWCYIYAPGIILCLAADV